MRPDDLEIIEARLRVGLVERIEQIDIKRAGLIATTEFNSNEAWQHASDETLRMAARHIAMRHRANDTTEVLAALTLVYGAIDRALRTCPYCMGGYCRAEAHAWLRDASCWRPPEA